MSIYIQIYSYIYLLKEKETTETETCIRKLISNEKKEDNLQRSTPVCSKREKMM